MRYILYIIVGLSVNSPGEWYSNPGDSLERYIASVSITVVQPQKKFVTLNTYPVRNGAHWTHPGSIEGHLRSAHGVDPSGMSREQMLFYHDALHEGRTSSRSASYASSAGGCPGGICPTSKAQRRAARHGY